MLLTDPPELKQHAARGDPPIEKWPGRIVTREDLMAACGDTRDWFRYGHRLQVYEEAWKEFADARARRRDFKSGFDFKQVLILGDFGTGKTTIAIKKLLQYFRRGHAGFMNASGLIGWRLDGPQMYTAIGFMPKHSIIAIDESSVHLPNLLTNAVAVDSWVGMTLNTRKQDCLIMYMSAYDWAISSGIRRECKEVWLPVPKDEIEIAGSEQAGSSRDPANDPANFRLAYYVWDDYPYKKKNIIEGPDPTAEKGFGPPDYTCFDEGEDVRKALLLNDTFQLAKVGAARLAGADNVKEDLTRFHGGAGPSESNRNGRKQQIWEDMLEFFVKHQENPPEYFQAGQIGKECNIGSGEAGRLLRELLPSVKMKQRHGYPSEDIYEAMEV